jgi:hypothetical protein
MLLSYINVHPLLISHIWELQPYARRGRTPNYLFCQSGSHSNIIITFWLLEGKLGNIRSVLLGWLPSILHASSAIPCSIPSRPQVLAPAVKYTSSKDTEMMARRILLLKEAVLGSITVTFAARALHSPRIALSLSFSSTYCIHMVQHQTNIVLLSLRRELYFAMNNWDVCPASPLVQNLQIDSTEVWTVLLLKVWTYLIVVHTNMLDLWVLFRYQPTSKTKIWMHLIHLHM